MLAGKERFSRAAAGALVALCIVALVLSLVRVEDVTLPPTVKVSPEEGPKRRAAEPGGLGQVLRDSSLPLGVGVAGGQYLVAPGWAFSSHPKMQAEEAQPGHLQVGAAEASSGTSLQA